MKDRQEADDEGALHQSARFPSADPARSSADSHLDAPGKSPLTAGVLPRTTRDLSVPASKGARPAPRIGTDDATTGSGSYAKREAAYADELSSSLSHAFGWTPHAAPAPRIADRGHERLNAALKVVAYDEHDSVLRSWGAKARWEGPLPQHFHGDYSAGRWRWDNPASAHAVRVDMRADGTGGESVEAWAGKLHATRVEIFAEPIVAVTEHGQPVSGIKLPPIIPTPASHVQLAPSSPASKSNADPIGAFVAAAKERGLSLSPQHAVLDRTFSAHPFVQAWLSSANGPPAEQPIQIEWQLCDARAVALAGLSSLWEPQQPQSPPASFPLQQPGDYQVTADLVHGGRPLARVAAPVHVERSPGALHAAMSMTPDARRAEQEARRNAVADASKPAGERKRLDDERAMLEFAAHEHDEQAPAMPDPGPHAVDFGAAQWGARAAPADKSWVVSTDPVFLRAMVEREYTKGGEPAVLELIGHMQNKANLARNNQTSPAEGERLWRLGWEIASAMGQQYALLKQENALFLADYERTAHHVVDFTLTQSEQRTLAELAKYGITRDEVTDLVETSDRAARAQPQLPQPRRARLTLSRRRSRSLAEPPWIRASGSSQPISRASRPSWACRSPPIAPSRMAFGSSSAKQRTATSSSSASSSARRRCSTMSCTTGQPSRASPATTAGSASCAVYGMTW